MKFRPIDPALENQIWEDGWRSVDDIDAVHALVLQLMEDGWMDPDTGEELNEVPQ